MLKKIIYIIIRSKTQKKFEGEIQIDFILKRPKGNKEDLF